MTNQDEIAWVEAVQNGDTEAFEPLMELHVRRLRAFVALKAPIPSLIDEATHETFVYAYRNIAKFKAGTNFFAWLKAIASNILRAEIQRYARQDVQAERYMHEMETTESDSNETLLVSDDLEQLEVCVESLPPNTKKLLKLKYTLGHSSAEMAKILQRSRAWIRTALFRIREELKKCVEQKLAAQG